MTVSDEPFWNALRRSIDRAEAAAADEHAAAEQLLVDTHIEPAERLDEARIDALVARALEPAAESAPAPKASASAPRRFLAAALALLLTPQFLAAAAVATVAVASTAILLQRTTQTLTFQRAIETLVSDRQSAANRDAAQGTVYVDLVEAIEAVRVAAAAGDLGAQARGVLQRLRGLLVQPEPFVLRRLPGSPLVLGNQVMDPGLDPVVREQALARLGELMAYGVSALKAIERAAAPPGVRQDNRVLLEQLAARLR